jgi:hypothetical protein
VFIVNHYAGSQYYGQDIDHLPQDKNIGCPCGKKCIAKDYATG